MSLYEKFKRFLDRLIDFLFKEVEEAVPEDIPLERSDENPIICPKPENGWEAWQTFNPGAVLLEDEVHFIYRAIGTGGASRLGWAKSQDGFKIDERLPYPIYRHIKGEGKFSYYSQASGGGFGGAEDPRATYIEEDGKLYITYTAFNGGIRVALSSIDIDDFLNQRWNWSGPSYLSPPDEVHKNWVLFPEKIGGRYAVLHSLNPRIQIDYLDSLNIDRSTYIDSHFGGLEREGVWDNHVRGAGAPPIKTEDGWLLFYHAMSNNEDRYKVGAYLLDHEDPTQILHRSQEPILEPKMPYENNGHKAGVVYVSGAVVKDGNLIIYYGGSDSYVCSASADLQKFLSALKRGVGSPIDKKQVAA